MSKVKHIKSINNSIEALLALIEIKTGETPKGEDPIKFLTRIVSVYVPYSHED